VHQTVRELRAFYQAESEALTTQCMQEQDQSTVAVIRKRIEVLNRRGEYLDKIGQIESNLNHQLLLLQDTFGLISDEMRARPPEQVLADIDDVVSQTNTMTRVLDELGSSETGLGF
jgi:hypothetical protein